MAYKGKATCKILKDIRRKIAEENDIELVIKECTYQGDCSGTCPRCEAEVAYLERELAKREAMGKAVRITGLAAASFAAAACSLKPQQKPAENTEDDILDGEVLYMPDSTESEFATTNEDSAWIAGGKRLEEEDLQPAAPAESAAKAAIAEKRTAGKPAPKEEELMKQEGEDALPDDEIVAIPADCRPLAGMIRRPDLPEEMEFPEEGEAEEVFTVAEKMPEFPGGQEALIKYMAENVKYPVFADEARREGKSVVQFTVTKTGQIVDAEVVRSSGWEELDKEALRVVKAMPNWKPGEQRGKAVAVRYTIPVNFKLSD